MAYLLGIIILGTMLALSVLAYMATVRRSDGLFADHVAGPRKLEDHRDQSAGHRVP